MDLRPSIKVGHSCRMQKSSEGLLPHKILCFVPFKLFDQTLPYRSSSKP